MKNFCRSSCLSHGTCQVVLLAISLESETLLFPLCIFQHRDSTLSVSCNKVQIEKLNLFT